MAHGVGFLQAGMLFSTEIDEIDNFSFAFRGDFKDRLYFASFLVAAPYKLLEKFRRAAGKILPVIAFFKTQKMYQREVC
jgi:hypothetical protein